MEKENKIKSQKRRPDDDVRKQSEKIMNIFLCFESKR